MPGTRSGRSAVAGLVIATALAGAAPAALRAADAQALPVVYDRVIHGTSQPFLVRIGVIFTMGIGWEKIVATATGR